MNKQIKNEINTIYKPMLKRINSGTILWAEKIILIELVTLELHKLGVTASEWEKIQNE